jgi:hypothetical protein
MKCGLLAQQRRRKYAVSLPHILQPRSGPSSQRLADFLRDLAPSSSNYHDAVTWCGELRLHPCNTCLCGGPWDRLKLSNWAPLGVEAFRACWDSAIEPVCKIVSSADAWSRLGQTQHLTKVMCTRCPDCSPQPASGKPWQPKRRHSCAVMLCKACASKRFQNQRADLWQKMSNMRKIKWNLDEI